MNDKAYYSLGIDIGSTSVKIAILNNDNLKNIWAFENGKANNIKYIFYYFNLFDSDSDQKEYARGLFNIL